MGWSYRKKAFTAGMVSVITLARFQSYQGHLCTLSTFFHLTSMQIHLGFNYSHILYIITAAQYLAHCPHLRCPWFLFLRYVSLIDFSKNSTVYWNLSLWSIRNKINSREKRAAWKHMTPTGSSVRQSYDKVILGKENHYREIQMKTTNQRFKCL